MADIWEPPALPPAVKAALSATMPAQRGFDDTFPGCLPHAALDTTGPTEQPTDSEDVRGTLAAIAELASWHLYFEPADPQDAETRHALVGVALDLEALARALWCAVCTYRADDQDDETEDTET